MCRDCVLADAVTVIHLTFVVFVLSIGSSAPFAAREIEPHRPSSRALCLFALGPRVILLCSSSMLPSAWVEQAVLAWDSAAELSAVPESDAAQVRAHGLGGLGMSLDNATRAALMKVVDCKRGARATAASRLLKL
jgi:hypothetical protein